MTHQDEPQPHGSGDQAAPGQPAYGQPGSWQPQYAQPQYAQPAYGQPHYGQAAYGHQPPQGSYPAPYGPPPGYPYAPPPRTNGLAVASLVLGILWIYWIGSVLALVFGYMARNQIRERGESGAGMATAGIVLGWVGVGAFVLFAVLGVAVYA